MKNVNNEIEDLLNYLKKEHTEAMSKCKHLQ